MAPLPRLTNEELKQLIREAVREELSHAGLLLQEEEHIFSARDDFRFLRRFRLAVDSTASNLGKSVIAVLTAGLLAVVWLGWKLSIRE